MKREFLRELGLSEEQIEKVMSEHGKTVTDTTAKLAAAEESKKALEAQLVERDKDIKDLKKGAEDNAELAQKYADLETKYKGAKAEYEQQIKDTNLNHAVDMALTGKVHDAGIVRGLLDRTKLTLDEQGQLGGLDEQLKGLSESKPSCSFQTKQQEQTRHLTEHVRPAVNQHHSQRLRLVKTRYS